VAYGPGISTAAVLLTSYGNVPPERAANLIRMLLAVSVSPGFVDKASERLGSVLEDAGFDAAMQAALAAESALGADETPVNVLRPDTGPETGEPETGSPHVLIIRTPGGKLTWPRAPGSRRHAAITKILAFFTGFLIADGYGAYQDLLPQLAGMQQCCQHIIRRCRAVAQLGPGSLQSWAEDVIKILREAHQAIVEARARASHLTSSSSSGSASVTTNGPSSGSRTTGTGTGTTATTPGSSSAPGSKSTPARSGWSLPSHLPSGRTTSPSREPRPPSVTRQSPGTGTLSEPSPAGAASAPTSTRRQRTA
jgi:Transposase IS66 family